MNVGFVKVLTIRMVKAQKAVDFILGISYEPKPTNAVPPQPMTGEEQEAEFVSQEIGNDLPF